MYNDGYQHEKDKVDNVMLDHIKYIMMDINMRRIRLTCLIPAARAAPPVLNKQVRP